MEDTDRNGVKQKEEEDEGARGRSLSTDEIIYQKLSEECRRTTTVVASSSSSSTKHEKRIKTDLAAVGECGTREAVRMCVDEPDRNDVAKQENVTVKEENVRVKEENVSVEQENVSVRQEKGRAGAGMSRNKALDVELMEESERISSTAAVSGRSEKLADFRRQLPSFQMRCQIVDLVREHQVILVSGETGCGKTTQVLLLIRYLHT